MLVQKLEEEYKHPDSPISKTPAVAGQVLVKGDHNRAVVHETEKLYRSATVTCMFMMQSSQPDIFNVVQGLARHMGRLMSTHL